MILLVIGVIVVKHRPNVVGRYRSLPTSKNANKLARLQHYFYFVVREVHDSP